MSATAWRDAALTRLGAERFDLLVVGGGITGAGIARDAALRGLRTALVEQGDFACGTSSRSSRLVHGGVRYLEHGHLHLVFEASRERRTLLRIAPHLVRPLAFTWPVYRGARIGRLKLAAGLGLYDALALFRNVERHAGLSAHEVLAAEPALRPDALTGGARYFDASTDDARLTLANALAAVEAGACALTHARVASLPERDGRIAGAVVHDLLSGRETLVQAEIVVNATGPWSDGVRRLVDEGAGGAVRGSKGAHVAVPRQRLGNAGAVTMLHPRDGRVLFALPAGALSIVGTTETEAEDGPDDIRATGDDVRYLLEAANAYFPHAALAPGDVVAAWAGIRPLAAGLARADAGSASREHAITVGAGGMISVTGGKLTTYREIAEQVVDRVLTQRGGPRRAPCRTGVVPLPGGDRPLADVRLEAEGVVPDSGVRERLVTALGTRWRAAWQAVAGDAALGERVTPDLPYTGAEYVHAARREMACTLGDLLIRRSHAAFETPDHALALAARVAAIVAPVLGWDAPRVAAERQRFALEVERTFAVRPG